MTDVLGGIPVLLPPVIDTKLTAQAEKSYIYPTEPILTTFRFRTNVLCCGVGCLTWSSIVNLKRRL